ncbi:MAG: hypothetical protein ACSHX7_02570 [Luteolibacter sp.]
MSEFLTLLLRVAGAGLILLAVLHVPIGRRLKWGEDGKNMTAVNEQIFHVHTFFVCVVLVMMGLPCLLMPRVFLELSDAGLWMAGSLAVFWGVRLFCQFFVYKADLWRGKRLETWLHCWFSFVWFSLAALFILCFCFQMGWVS